MFYRIEKLYCIALIIFILSVAGCSGSTDTSNAQLVQASVEATWNTYRTTYGVPSGAGLAVYIETPTGNYFASSGIAPPVNKYSRFRIASNTKTFTSAAIMLLKQQGKLRIYDTIDSIIPGQTIPYVPATAQYNIPYKSTITIQQLLSHTAGVYDVINDEMPLTDICQYSGLNYYYNVITTEPDFPNHQFSPAEFIGVVAECRACYGRAGTIYKYSNTGYSILATIIERVSQMSYDQFVIQNLIVPNGLTSTTVPMQAIERTIPAPFTPGYVFYQGTLTDVTIDNISANIAEGNIISTPVDLARWIRRLIRGEAGLDAATVQEMITPTPQSGSTEYGLGISHTVGLGYGHDGSHRGYHSIMMYDPTTDVTVVLYFNLWNETAPYTPRPELFSLVAKAALDAKKAIVY